MSYADDFGHDIPPDDYPGGSGYKISAYDYMKKSNDSIIMSFIAIHKDTDKALLVEFDDGKVWLPKSKIWSLNKEKFNIMIPRWLSENFKYIKE